MSEPEQSPENSRSTDSEALSPAQPLSFAVIALGVAGSAAAVLAVSSLAIALLPIAPGFRALIAVAGIVVALLVMSKVSKRLTDRAIAASELRADGADAKDTRNGTADSGHSVHSD